MKKVIYGFLLVAMVAAILALTFQGPTETTKLSEGVRHLVKGLGIRTTPHEVRSNAHLIQYFALGLILSLLARELGWSWKVVILIGCLFGVFDEGIRVWLPTREFDPGDLMRDFIGITAGMGLCHLGKRLAIRRT